MAHGESRLCSFLTISPLTFASFYGRIFSAGGEAGVRVCLHRQLSPIASLREALDIAYCHHKRWDGSGYPRSLKSRDIPLAVRLFAVIDVTPFEDKARR
ncbi:MAG: hypothetical protein NZM11_09380 [Anaerolineales bacterium]|nr:hypothetical protein [Anaerolineales bacterium]